MKKNQCGKRSKSFKGAIPHETNSRPLKIGRPGPQKEAGSSSNHPSSGAIVMLVSRATTTPKNKTHRDHHAIHIPDWIFECHRWVLQPEDHPTDPGPTVNPNKMLGQRQSEQI